MYADRYSTGPAIKPGSLGLALAATALPLVALVVGLQIKQVLTRDKPISTVEVYTPPPPPLDPPPPQPETRSQTPPRERVFTPNPLPLPTDNRVETTPQPPLQPPPPLPPGPAADPGPPVVALPKIVGAQVDPRYAGLLQPPYPPAEIRAGRAGTVVLRVLIGSDGRVRQVERVSAASDAFFAATEKQALGRWRFKPATRDGVAFEQWKQMTVRFEIPVE